MALTLPRLTEWLVRHKGATVDDVAAFYRTRKPAELVELDRQLRAIRADLHTFRRAEDRRMAGRLAHDVAEGLRRRLDAARAERDAARLAVAPVDLDALTGPAADRAALLPLHHAEPEGNSA